MNKLDRLFLAACLTVVVELAQGALIVLTTCVGPCGFVGDGLDFWRSFHAPGTWLAGAWGIKAGFNRFLVQITTSAVCQIATWYAVLAAITAIKRLRRRPASHRAS